MKTVSCVVENKQKSYKNRLIVLFFACVAFLCNLIGGIFSYPKVEMDLATDNLEEQILLFHCDEGEEYSDEKHVAEKIKTRNTNTYCFYISEDFENIRICLGTGKNEISRFVIKESFFYKNEVPLQKLANSVGVVGGSVRYEDGIILLESDDDIAFEMYLDISLVRKADRSFDTHFMIGIIVCSIVLFLILYILRFIVKKIIKYDMVKKGVKVIRGWITQHNRWLFFVLLTAVFFSLPMIFTYDSAKYMEYTNFFDGKISWGEWGKTRGWAFPLLLWGAKGIFGETSYGIQTAFFLMYLCYIYVGYKIVKCVNDISVLIYVVFVLLNPVILGYFHLVLTEAVAAVVCVVMVFFLLQLQERLFCERMNYRTYYVKMILLTMLSSIYLYFLKQMFFVIPLIAFSINEIYMAVKKKTRLWAGIFSICVMLSVLLLCVKGWNIFIDSSEKIETMEENTMFVGLNNSGDELVNTYIARGAVNFEWNSDDNQIVARKNDKVVDIIEYKGKISSVHYWLLCLKSHPLLLMQGYIDNYLVLCNFYTLEKQENYLMSIAKIDKEISFTRGLENFSLAEYPRYYKNKINTYEEFCSDEKLIPYGTWTSENWVTKSLYGKFLLKGYNCVYTLSMLYAPIALVFHVVLAIKKESITHYNGRQTILSGTVVLYCCALSAMCMRIDRYAFPILLFAIFVFFNDVSLFVKMIIKIMGVTCGSLRSRILQQKYRT